MSLRVAAVAAIALAVAVPVATLRTLTTAISCCCPDQSRCRCPDHGKPLDSGPDTMQACHRERHDVVAAELPVFAPAARAITLAPTVAATTPAVSLPLPHAPPSPARPDAPS